MLFSTIDRERRAEDHLLLQFYQKTTPPPPTRARFRAKEKKGEGEEEEEEEEENNGLEEEGIRFDLRVFFFSFDDDVSLPIEFVSFFPPRENASSAFLFFSFLSRKGGGGRSIFYYFYFGLFYNVFAVTYNNFYEFGSNKTDPVHYAQKMNTRPWKIEVTGLVNKPKIFDIDDLLKTMPIEERLYRLRCVEAWAIAVPWTGFAFKELLKLVDPKASATHVKMETFYQPFTAQGQLAFWEPWAYTEALTIKEAMNDLAFLATGIYGHPLPKQHGAPIRLAVPWKYGFKNIKSIVKIELIDYRPMTFWTALQGLEYDFTANVDPRIPHPRWPQNLEKMIGTGVVRATLPYNGYGKYVAELYS